MSVDHGSPPHYVARDPNRRRVSRHLRHSSPMSATESSCTRLCLLVLERVRNLDLVRLAQIVLGLSIGCSARAIGDNKGSNIEASASVYRVMLIAPTSCIVCILLEGANRLVVTTVRNRSCNCSISATTSRTVTLSKRGVTLEWFRFCSR